MRLKNLARPVKMSLANRSPEGAQRIPGFLPLIYLPGFHFIPPGYACSLET
jgi:hypothetical protein